MNYALATSITLLTIFYLINNHALSRTTPIKSSSEHKFIQSLSKGNWVKLICGASNQDLSLVRNICLLYTIAGVDCIDLSADFAVINAACEGINQAQHICKNKLQFSRPLIMVSVNDDADPHFRKAFFDTRYCPCDCSRPCERVCPAAAIPSLHNVVSNTGVIEERCYGCGRCIPVCPYDKIDARNYIVDASYINNLFESGLVDGIEIHTQFNHDQHFEKLMNAIERKVLPQTKVLSVSFPNMKEHTKHYIEKLQSIITSRSSWNQFKGVQIWQTDGRPMSGDIGKGAAHASNELALKVLTELSQFSPTQLQPNSMPSSDKYDEMNTRINLQSNRHFIQLAGGTNNFSPQLARHNGLTNIIGFGGYAFGGYARKRISQRLIELEEQLNLSTIRIEEHAVEFEICLNLARNLVASVKESF